MTSHKTHTVCLLCRVALQFLFYGSLQKSYLQSGGMFSSSWCLELGLHDPLPCRARASLTLATAFIRGRFSRTSYYRATIPQCLYLVMFGLPRRRPGYGSLMWAVLGLYQHPCNSVVL